MIKYLLISFLIFYLYRKFVGNIQEKLGNHAPPQPPRSNTRTQNMGEYVDYEELKD